MLPNMLVHLPLKKFLQKTALNVKGSNLVVKLSEFHLRFKFIKGIKTQLLMLYLDYLILNLCKYGTILTTIIDNIK